MEKCFNIDGKRIILYGYDNRFGRAETIRKKIEKANVESIEFINNTKTFGDNSYTYNDYLMKKNNKSDVVFVLCFQNVNTHMNIARELSRDGFNNILFLPFGIGIFDSYCEKKMRSAYNELLYGNVEKLTNIPCYSALTKVKNTDIIKEYKEYIVFWTDIRNLKVMELIREQDVSEEYRNSDYSKVPVTEYRYHIELYEYIYENGCYPYGYLANNSMGRDAEEFLAERKELFDTMKMKLKYDWNYFIDSPVLVSAKDESPEYYVIDGLHRTVFLYKNGFLKIPVICKKKEIHNRIDLMGGRQ